MFNKLDYVILAILIVSVFLGSWRGLVKEILSLVRWIAVWVAFHYEWMVASYVPPDWPGGKLTQWFIGFFTIFLLIILLSDIVFTLLKYTMSLNYLHSLNSSLGFLFGIFRGLLFISILILIGMDRGFSNREIWKDSFLMPYSLQALRVARLYFPILNRLISK